MTSHIDNRTRGALLCKLVLTIIVLSVSVSSVQSQLIYQLNNETQSIEAVQLWYNGYWKHVRELPHLQKPSKSLRKRQKRETMAVQDFRCCFQASFEKTRLIKYLRMAPKLTYRCLFCYF